MMVIRSEGYSSKKRTKYEKNRWTEVRPFLSEDSEHGWVFEDSADAPSAAQIDELCVFMMNYPIPNERNIELVLAKITCFIKRDGVATSKLLDALQSSAVAEVVVFVKAIESHFRLMFNTHRKTYCVFLEDSEERCIASSALRAKYQARKTWQAPFDLSNSTGSQCQRATQKVSRMNIAAHDVMHYDEETASQIEQNKRRKQIGESYSMRATKRAKVKTSQKSALNENTLAQNIVQFVLSKPIEDAAVQRVRPVMSEQLQPMLKQCREHHGGGKEHASMNVNAVKPVQERERQSTPIVVVSSDSEDDIEGIIFRSNYSARSSVMNK